MASDDTPIGSNEPAPAIRQLSDEDARALDALLGAEAGDGVTGVWGGDPARLRRVSALLNLLDAATPAPGSAPGSVPDDALVARTMTAIEQARQRERFASQVQMLSTSDGSIGASWRQVLSAAAVFVIGLSLLLPFMDRSRAESQRIACAANLMDAGQAFGAYAADFGGVMPRGRVEPGSAWWHVGQTPKSDDAPVRSNAAHLYILISRGYLQPEQLACPENPHALRSEHREGIRDWASAEAVSYSYQNQYTDQPFQLLATPNLAVLADKNPLFVIRVGRVAFDQDAPRAAPSKVHDNRGQNVLKADGTVAWTLRPMIRRAGQRGVDNIWVAQGVDRYTGNERPSSPDDSFLVP